MKKILLLVLVALAMSAGVASGAKAPSPYSVCGSCDPGDPYAVYTSAGWEYCHSPWYYQSNGTVTNGVYARCLPSGWSI